MLLLLFRRERLRHEPWLPAASINAAEVDQLLLALLLHLARRARAGVRSDVALHREISRRQQLDRGAVAQKTWRIETAWTAATLLVFFGLFIWGADLYVRLFQPPADALKIYVDRQAMDVESGACRRPARDQRPASARWPAHRTDHDLRGRDPRFLDPRIPHQTRCAAGPLRNAVVHGDRGRAPTICSARSSAASTMRRWWARSWRCRRRDYQSWLEQNGARRDIGRGRQDTVHALRLQRLSWRQRRRRQRSGRHGARPPLAGLYGSPCPCRTAPW